MGVGREGGRGQREEGRDTYHFCRRHRHYHRRPRPWAYRRCPAASLLGLSLLYVCTFVGLMREGEGLVPRQPDDDDDEQEGRVGRFARSNGKYSQRTAPTGPPAPTAAPPCRPFPPCADGGGVSRGGIGQVKEALAKCFYVMEWLMWVDAAVRVVRLRQRAWKARTRHMPRLGLYVRVCCCCVLPAFYCGRVGRGGVVS